MDTIPPFRFSDAEVQQCPYGADSALRRERPVYREPDTGFFVVSRGKEIREVLRRPEIFGNTFDISAFKPGGANLEAIEIYRKDGWEQIDMLIAADPPAHTRHRALVEEAFSRRPVEALAPQIEKISVDLIDGFASAGEVEFVQEFATMLPLTVTVDLLGLPRGDIQLLREATKLWVEALSLASTPEREMEGARRGVEIQHYLVEHYEDRRQNPKDDLISMLVHAKVGGERPLETQELLWITTNLIVAGHETSVDHLASGMYRLVCEPELQGTLRNAPGKVPAFVEEILRLESPVQSLPRVSKVDAEIGGIAIPAKSVVILRLGSGNRDEEAYENAPELDLTRKKPGAHLSFGAGVHTCIGAQLLRLESAIAFRTLLGKLNNIRLADAGATPTYRPNMFVRGLQELKIAFDLLGQ